MPQNVRHPPRVDRDGITMRSTGKVRTGVWLLLLALALVAGMLVLIVRPFIAMRASVAAPRSGEHMAASRSGRDPRALPAQRSRESGPGERPQLPSTDAHRAAAGDANDPPPADGEQVAADGEAEEPSGIALFPPPGTDPIKPGIVVPDDFELPPGFVRHYQTTDNGKQLSPILMFHPDYQPVDESGEKIALPPDRVVPPEMAPPGLPHQMLDVPDDTVPMIEGPNDRPDAD